MAKANRYDYPCSAGPKERLHSCWSLSEGCQNWWPFFCLCPDRRLPKAARIWQ